MRSSLAAPALVLALAACSPNDPEPRRIDGIPVDHTESAPLIEAHFEAWTKGSAAAYEALLEKPGAGRGDAGFRFYFLDMDAVGFPWISEPFWDYDVEMEIVRNMTDPMFSGYEPPVETIRAEYVTLTETDMAEGHRVTTCDAVITVLVGPGTGWVADTRLEIETARREDGLLRIRRIAEIEKLRATGSAEAMAVETTFAGIKVLYLSR